jgi:hypothetical protein
VSIRLGDAVFIRSGTPAIVKDRNPTTAQLLLDQDYEHVQEDMRHGYINGLSGETRAQLNEILDDVKGATDDPRERVDAMQAKLTEIDGDPTKLPLSRYLRAEMLHVMNAHNIKPKEYSVQELKAR